MVVFSDAGLLGGSMSLEGEASLEAGVARGTSVGALRVRATAWSWICMAGRCVEGRCAVFVCRVLWRTRGRRFRLLGRCWSMVSVAAKGNAFATTVHGGAAQMMTPTRR